MDWAIGKLLVGAVISGVIIVMMNKKPRKQLQEDTTGNDLSGKSEGERRLSLILNDMGIKFVRNYNLDDVVYDYYLPGYDHLIEYDDSSHFMECIHSERKSIRAYDRKKNNVARSNNKPLIRLDYTTVLSPCTKEVRNMVKYELNLTRDKDNLPPDYHKSNGIAYSSKEMYSYLLTWYDLF